MIRNKLPVMECNFPPTKVLLFNEGPPQDGLTWWKKLICRTFGIKPEVKYNYSIKFECEKSDWINRGDILVSTTNVDCNWYVISVIGSIVSVVSTNAICRITECPKRFILIANAFGNPTI